MFSEAFATGFGGGAPVEPGELPEEDFVEVTYSGCALPEMESIRRREYDREILDGFDPDARCTFCFLPDELANRFPKSLEEVSQYEKKQACLLPEAVRHDMVAKKFNETRWRDE